ncbi:MAG: alcohol dehydrogenase catalytic domain-containing protein [Thermoplasmata archaeon]|nr:alcohol dehydrogenase catalytic domain-containing protein [Thermoplasmata archaeon]
MEAGRQRVKGLGFSAHGGLDRLGWVDLPAPEPGTGEVRIRVRAAAFNRLDRFVLEGIPGVPVELPHIVGSDASGVVDRVGAGVTDLAVGTEVLVNPGLWDGTCEYCRAGQESLCRDFRILGEHTQGSATEYIVVPRRNVHPKPAGWSWGQAAAAPLVFQTAWRALRTVGELRPGETVAVIGAGGSVAPAAIQVAHRLGGRVVVVGRTAEKVERAVALGAEAGLVTTPEKPHDRLLWEWSRKRGIDLIFDSVGADSVPRSVRALARGGRLVVIGATEGSKVELDLKTLFWRQGSIRGSTMASRSEFDQVYNELVQGHLRPVVDSEWDWDQGIAAFGRLSDPGLFGKVVLRTAA